MRYNGQIFEMMVAHGFNCLIQRLILDAMVHLPNHEFANKSRLGIMAEAASLPPWILAFQRTDQTIA